MKINPVYGKEVKLRVRSLKFAMTILFFNLGLIAIALLGFEVFFNVNMNYRIDYSGATQVYFIIICLEAAMVAFLVPVFTAGSIAGEREKQTLEILLTTVLKPGQIVIGKLMSSISMVVLLVFSSLPVISIVFTIGGINITDLMQFVLLIIIMSLFIGSMGIFASALVKRAVPATVLSFVMVGIVCGLTAIGVLIANTGANIYYYNMQNINANIKVPDVTWAAYPLLINPAFTLIDMVLKNYGAIDMVSKLGPGLNGKLLPFVEDYWFLCSMVLQILFTLLFIKLAALLLDPLRRKERSRKVNKKDKKEKHKKKQAALPMLILAVILSLVPANTDTASATIKTKQLDANGQIKISKDDITATIGIGYKGKTKYERYIKVDAVIENKGSDFTGKIRIECSRSDADGSVAVQKAFAAASGETKRVQFASASIEPDAYIKVSICDEEDNVICSEYVSTKWNYDTILYIGTLSDNQDSLDYISSGLAADKNAFDASDDGLVFQLGIDDITEDYKILDSLDIIIIDDFDTSKFSDIQIEAIKAWVSNGGTLFLGSGADADKVLKAFSGKLLNGTIGSVKQINTNFGISRKKLTSLLGENRTNRRVPLDITQISIKGSEPVLSDGRNNLISSLDYDNGNILVSEFSLGLSSGTAALYGPVITDVIKNNISDKLKSNSKEGFNPWSSYSDIYTYEYEVLNLNETDSLPNVKLYAVILLVYVIIAGPVAYIIMKKKDKRNLLWLIVPVLSVAFSVTIYLIGTSTRIQRPFINYVSTIKLPEKAGGKNNVNTKFTLTSPSNKSYEAVLPANMAISPAITNGYYHSPSEMDSDKYDYGVEYGANNTKLLLNSLAAFESVGFEMENKSTTKGTVEIDVKKNEKQISGYISNKMSCGLEDCIFYYKGDMYYIGNLPAGKSVDISKQKEYKESQYSFNFESQLSAALGGGFYSNDIDIQLKRKIGMLHTFVANNRIYDTWFYGFTEEGSEAGFTDNFTFDKYGETGVYKIAQVEETFGGYDVIGSLEQYAVDYDSAHSNGYYVYDPSISNFEVTYKFPENFTLKRLIYNSETAGGAEFKIKKYGYSEYAFPGIAKVKDKDTGKYVKLLESAKKADIKDMEKYLEPDGSLKIYYDINSSVLLNVHGPDTFSQPTLPRVKLAGTYKNAKRKSR